MISKIRLYRFEKRRFGEIDYAWGTCKISGIKRTFNVACHYNHMRNSINMNICEPIDYRLDLEIVTSFKIPCSSKIIANEISLVPLTLARMNKRNFVWR